jgi:hypothetical protein
MVGVFVREKAFPGRALFKPQSPWARAGEEV